MAKRNTKEFDWCSALSEDFQLKFGKRFSGTTTFSVVIGACVTKRDDEKPMTNEQRMFIDGFMACHEVKP